MQFFYTHSTKVSFKHFIAHTQSKLIVKKLFVAMYGIELQQLSSGLGANTLNVAQHPSNFSTLNTLEHSELPLLLHEAFEQIVVESLLVGIVQSAKKSDEKIS